jgi:hypothetical protein
MADKIPVVAAALLLGGFALTLAWPPLGPPVIFLGAVILLRHVVRAFIALAGDPDQPLPPVSKHHHKRQDAQ